MSDLDDAEQPGSSHTSSNITFHPIINAGIVDVDNILVPLDGTAGYAGGTIRGGNFTFKAPVEVDGMENAVLTRKTTVDIPSAGPAELPYVLIISCTIGFSWLVRIFTMAVVLSSWVLVASLVYITIIVYASGDL